MHNVLIDAFPFSWKKRSMCGSFCHDKRLTNMSALRKNTNQTSHAESILIGFNSPSVPAQLSLPLNPFTHPVFFSAHNLPPSSPAAPPNMLCSVSAIEWRWDSVLNICPSYSSSLAHYLLSEWPSPPLHYTPSLVLAFHAWMNSVKRHGLHAADWLL